LFARQLTAALRRLQGLQEEAMAKEAELKDELERAKLERAVEVEQGKEEARILVESAKREAEVLRANMEEIAKQDAQKIVERGQEELLKSRLELLNNIETDAVRLSTELLTYTFTRQVKEEFQHHLTLDLIEEISRIDQSQFSVKAESVTVTSSFPLTGDERARLSHALSEKLGGPVTLKEQSDPALITGLIVQIGALIIDGSLRNKLRKVVPLLRNSRKEKVSDTGV
jgi:F0F1-type ATP synthase delta subunit